jgi:hypothetical protein
LTEAQFARGVRQSTVTRSAHGNLLHYSDLLKLTLTERDKADLIEYLKSL